LWKVHALGVAVDFSGDTLEVFLQVVGERSHQNMLIGVSNSVGVNSFHVVMVDQRAQHRFYGGTAALGEHACVVPVAVQFLVHLVVQRFVDAVHYAFLLFAG